MMKIISHRANIDGPNKEIENHPDQIISVIENGYDCEIDVWLINGKIYLGHDCAQYEITIDFILRYAEKLWCHCKNLESLIFLLKYPEVNCFYHDKDDYVITSKKYIWCYPGKDVPEQGIAVMPEWHPDIKISRNIFGICTDYIHKVNEYVV